MLNQIMARYCISHIIVSIILVNLERLELFSTAAPIMEELHQIITFYLTSQLIGMLMRFPTEELAFMGGTVAMFYQVKVPDSQRSFLGYLWWSNNDLNTELVDFEMWVHMFGGTSSPGCCNYALRWTDMYNARNYDTEVAETLLHNFHVGDPLKSLKSKEITIQLIKVIRKMCGEGGFKVSSKVVFQSIPECHQRSG